MLPHDLSDPRATLEDFALLAFRSRAAGKGPTIDFREIFGAVRFPTFSTVSVESRCGAVALGRTYLLPSLSSGGASIVPPWLRFHIPLIEPDRQISRIRLSDKTSRFRVHAICSF